ncbi:unnamed protein product, partial [Ilex paraguariensis]
METLDMAQKETLVVMYKTIEVDGVIKVMKKGEHSGKDTCTDCTQEGNNSDLERNNPSEDREPINLHDTVEENQVTDKEAIVATMEKRNDQQGGIVLKEDNEMGLYSTKEPLDKGFHSEEDVVGSLECSEVESLNSDNDESLSLIQALEILLFSVDSSSAAALKQFTHYLSAQTDNLQLISFLGLYQQGSANLNTSWTLLCHTLATSMTMEVQLEFASTTMGSMSAGLLGQLQALEILLFSVDSSSAAALKQFTHYLSAQTDNLQLISFLGLYQQGSANLNTSWTLLCHTLATSMTMEGQLEFASTTMGSMSAGLLGQLQ